MKPSISLAFITAVTFLPGLVAKAKEVPFDGPVIALISIVKGFDVGQEETPKDVTSDLDGTVLELGNTTCTIAGASCVFEHIKPGAHAPGIMIHNEKAHIAYRYLGTSAGPIVTVERTSSGSLVVAPQGTNKLVFKLERYYSDDDGDIIAAPEASRYQNVKIDGSLKLEIWLHVIDESESVSYYRRPSSHELNGTRLRLGSFTCTVEGMNCIFEKVISGKYHLDASFKASDNSKLALEKDDKPFEVVLDWWTKRPKVSDRKEPVTVTIEKTVLKKSPSAR